MEPRELWERNTLLAEAFCSTDDRVREAQAVMDEALASRTRTLAAFAVTVGSDAAVADLMGLNEREVRVARRTVGKEDARIVADQLLSPPAETSPHPPEPAAVAPPAGRPAQPPAAPPATGQATGPATGQAAVPTAVPPSGNEPLTGAAWAKMPQPRPETPPPGRPPLMEQQPSGERVAWTAGMDSVLLWSWESDLDLQTVATELGLSSKELLLRAQMLASEGRLTPKTPAYDVSQSGRHRRHDTLQYPVVPDSPETLYMSSSPYG
ncbi:hypothetical protein AB0912_03790 [Streptomyces sp. NPDC007084]|uniref:hypothetical protein n=1 Tax=Streptomyces sp. NPDC007084 TaxID=3154313 RepID=UPI003456DE07